MLFILDAVLGIGIVIPFLLDPRTVQTHMHANCIQYNSKTIVDAFIFAPILRHFYVIIIVLPLLISRDLALKWMGVPILLVLIATYLFYSHAFNSVWCFFSAIISIYIIYVIRRKKDHGLNFVIE